MYNLLGEGPLRRLRKRSVYLFHCSKFNLRCPITIKEGETRGSWYQSLVSYRKFSVDPESESLIVSTTECLFVVVDATIFQGKGGFSQFVVRFASIGRFVGSCSWKFRARRNQIKGVPQRVRDPNAHARVQVNVFRPGVSAFSVISVGGEHGRKFRTRRVLPA